MPLSIGGVTVTFDGVAAPLTYASTGQINLGVPWEVKQKTSTVMQVMLDGKLVTSRQFAVAASSPSLFVDTGGTSADGNDFFPAIVLNSDGTKNSFANPAQAGSWVTMFLNGASAYAGVVPPKTGSITDAAPIPIGISAGVMAGTTSLETGPLIPWPGVLAGLYQLPVRMRESTQSGTHVETLRVSVDGVPAAPLVYIDKVYQSAGLVWVIEGVYS